VLGWTRREKWSRSTTAHASATRSAVSLSRTSSRSTALSRPSQRSSTTHGTSSKCSSKPVLTRVVFVFRGLEEVFLCPSAEEKWTTGSAESDRKQRHQSSQWLGGLARRYCETRPEKPKSGARRAESVDGDWGSKPPSPAAGCDVWGALLPRPVGSGAKLRKMWFWYISGLEKIKSQHFAVGWPFSAFGFVQKKFHFTIVRGPYTPIAPLK